MMRMSALALLLAACASDGPKESLPGLTGSEADTRSDVATTDIAPNVPSDDPRCLVRCRALVCDPSQVPACVADCDAHVAAAMSSLCASCLVDTAVGDACGPGDDGLPSYDAGGCGRACTAPVGEMVAFDVSPEDPRCVVLCRAADCEPVADCQADCAARLSGVHALCGDSSSRPPRRARRATTCADLRPRDVRGRVPRRPRTPHLISHARGAWIRRFARPPPRATLAGHACSGLVKRRRPVGRYLGPSGARMVAEVVDPLRPHPYL